MPQTSPNSHFDSKIFWILGCFLIGVLGSMSSHGGENLTYTRVLRFMPSTLVPAQVQEGPAIQILTQIGEGLLKYNRNALEPGIAQSWTISSSRMQYDFTLNPNAKFSDGKRISADDVIASITAALAPSSLIWHELSIIKGASAFHSGRSRSVSGLKKLNKNKIRIVLEKPFSPFLDILTAPSYSIFSLKSLEHLRKHQYLKVAVSGPYRIKKHIDDKLIEIERNPYYHSAEKVALDIVSYHIVSDRETAVTGLLNGMFDDIWPYRLLNNEIKKADRSLIEIPTMTAFTWLLSLNLKNGPLKEKKLRRILTQNVNIANFLKEQNFPPHFRAKGIIPLGMPGFPNQTSPVTSQLPSLNRQSIEAAGCSEKHICELEVIYASEITTGLEALFKDLRGFPNQLKIKLVKLPPGDWYKRIRSGQFQIAYFGANTAYNDTYMFLRDLLNPNYYPGLKTDEIKFRLEKALLVGSREERARIYGDIDELLKAQYAVIPIYHGDQPTRVVRSVFKGHFVPFIGYPYMKMMDINKSVNND